MNKTLRPLPRNTLALILALATLNLTVSCNYFKAIKIEDVTVELGKEAIRHHQNLNKYFVLHTTTANYHMQIIRLDADRDLMKVLVSSVDAAHVNYRPDAKSQNRYKQNSTQASVLNEVHIYTNTSVTATARGEASVPLSSLTRIDIIEHDSGRSTTSYVFGTLGIVAAAFAVVVLIILLTKSSCPFVYVHNGNQVEFKGEIYGGAIFKPLERDDYMPLGQATGSEVKIRISNELQERQYTNLAELIIAGHDSSISTCIDSRGVVHTISAPMAPIQAVLNSTDDMLPTVVKTDSSCCLFNNEQGENYSNALHMTFAKPANARQAKLLLHAKNSWWLDYTFTKFTQLFGSFYNSFVEEKRHANKDSLLAWSSRNGLPLSVYVRQGSEWKFVESIPTVGPMAARQFCIPIDVSEVKGEKLDIQVRCGFLTWELDEASVDYSADSPLHLARIVPGRASDELGREMTGVLAATDSRYLEQPVPGGRCEIQFSLPPFKKGLTYECYLHSRGYYEHVRNYKGRPDRELLESFRQTGAFGRFTHTLYDKLTRNSGLVPEQAHR